MKCSYSREIGNVPEKMFTVNSIATKVIGRLHLAFWVQFSLRRFSWISFFVIFGPAFRIFLSGSFLDSKFENTLLRRLY